MKTLKEKAPALWAVFFKSYELIELSRPYGCNDCPFAEQSNEWEDRPNPSDPDEGYYNCHLLNQEKIWGETPQCTGNDWRSKGAKEVEVIAEYAIQREIIEEKAAILLNEFSKMIQDESNGELTLNQLREKLLSGVDPRVVRAFNTNLKPTGSE